MPLPMFPAQIATPRFSIVASYRFSRFSLAKKRNLQMGRLSSAYPKEEKERTTSNLEATVYYRWLYK
jgi:hypothetical protein